MEDELPRATADDHRPLHADDRAVRGAAEGARDRAAGGRAALSGLAAASALREGGAGGLPGGGGGRGSATCTRRRWAAAAPPTRRWRIRRTGRGAWRPSGRTRTTWPRRSSRRRSIA